jgi:hypothetical protein
VDIRQAMIMLFARKLPSIRLFDHRETTAKSRDALCTATVGSVLTECAPRGALEASWTAYVVLDGREKLRIPL